MRILNKYKLLTFTALFALISSSCEITKLEGVNIDPNNPSKASLQLLLPTAENAVINSLLSLSQNSLGFAGMLNSADDYNLNNQSYNGTWNGFYTSMNNVEAIINSTKDVNSPHYLGIAQALKAFAMGNFVDQFGDAPYSEAWKASADPAILEPKFDKDSEIYEALIKLCDESFANLSKTSPVAVTTTGDFIYKGSIAKWKAFAKSTKIKLLLNSRKGRATGNADLAKAIAEGGFITNAADDFTYRFNSLVSPDSRHPWFQGAYLADNGFAYPSHQLMSEMILGKDPRLAFYFYRQTNVILDTENSTDRQTIPYGGTYLVTKPKFIEQYKAVFGDYTAEDKKYIAGFFGRDRGDNTGVPQDGALRTAPGCYPAGGLYSGREITPRALTGGRGSGNGIFPLLTTNNMKYYQIESILDGVGTGDAKVIFEAAIREHIKRVVDLGLLVDAANAKAPVAADVDAYVTKWLTSYTDASSNAAKLNVVMKQLWFSSWGQGNEIWNAMRRTGLPTTIVDPILRPKRQFALRLPYPSQEGNINKNATKYITEQIFDRDPIFWDKVKLKWQF
jgi:Starch-binding associating with outer membrane/Susd and RagB outer membrane lipoprotein